MNEFVKGSSKPIQKETLHEKICKSITHNSCFKEGGRKINVNAISEKQLFELSKGDYIFGEKEKHWKYYFRGQAQLSIHHENGILTCSHEICGYANTNNEDNIEEISEIFVI